MSYPCTFYLRPDGRTHLASITKINPEDAKWFEEHNAKLSAEELTTGEFIFYADVGVMFQGEPVEVMISTGPPKDPYEEFARLRKLAEEQLAADQRAQRGEF